MDNPSKVFLALTNGGYLDPQNEKHLHRVQTKMGLPLTKVEDLQEKRDIAAEKYDLYYRENGEDDDDAKETA